MPESVIVNLKAGAASGPLAVEPLPSGLFRVAEHPWLWEGFDYDDRIELRETGLNEFEFVRVVEPSSLAKYCWVKRDVTLKLCSIHPLGRIIGGSGDLQGTGPRGGVMAASQPSRLLLRAGRSSVKSCVEAGEMGEAGLTVDAQSTYDRLASEVEWPDRLANRVYLAVMVLPVAALYSTLRGRDWPQQDAVDAVQAAFLASGESQRNFFKLILKTRVGRRLFLRSLRPNWLGLTPPPSNQWHLTERSPTRVTIEIARCYRWDAFNLIGTPEVASVACAFEEHMMTPSPYLRITGRSMPTGADRCRFRFELLDEPKRQAVAR